MKIEVVDSQSQVYAKLQEFVSKHNLLFHSQAWLRNYSPQAVFQCAIMNNNGDVIGCFLYYRFKKSVFNFIISAPFTPNIALFYVNPSESVVGKNSFDKDLLGEVSDYFDKLAIPFVDINLPEEIVDTQPFIWKGYVSKTRYSYLLDLSLSKEILWANLSSEKRKSILKAEKDGLIIREAEDMALVYDLILQSLKRSGVAKNTEVIKNLLFSFATKTNSIAYVAYHNSLPIGATFCVISNKRSVYLFGGFDADNKHHGAGVSCMWQGILKAKSMGLEHFDFEGSMTPAIERYFREFGGKLVPYYNIQKVKPFLKTLLALRKRSPV